MAPRAAKAKIPICATPAEASVAPAIQRTGGFTLVELLVALALVGMIVALVPASLGRLRESVDYRDTVRAVVTDLRGARQKAMADGAEVRFLVDLEKGHYGLDGRMPRTLPSPLQMRVTVAGIEWAGQQAASIRFLPQGGATGGSIDILRPQGNGVRITVDWLSASVTQTAIDP